MDEPGWLAADAGGSADAVPAHKIDNVLETPDMRRILLGILSLVFLGVSVGIYIQGEPDTRFFLIRTVADDQKFLLSVCQRVGIVLGAMWLAYDQVLKLGQRSPPWLLGCIGLCLLVIVVRPKAIVVVAPLLAVVAAMQFVSWLFKPLPNPRRRSRTSAPSDTAKSSRHDRRP